MSLEAEKALLGALMLGSRTAEILDALEPMDYELPAHREIAAAAKRVRSRGVPVELIALMAELEAYGSIPHLEGGSQYLVNLAASVGNGEGWEGWSRLVKERSLSRRLVLLCTEFAARAKDGDVETILADLGREVASLALHKGGDLKQAGDIAAGLLGELERRSLEKLDRAGVYFGLPDLDDCLCGVRPGEICVIAADVGGGKSSLADQAMNHLVLNQGGTAVNFTLEMPAEQKVERSFAHLGRINSFKLRRGDLDKRDFETLFSVTRNLQGKPYYIQEATTLGKITAQLRAWRAKHPSLLGAFTVDFLQLVQSEELRGESRARAVGRVAYGLKYLAVELRVAGIAVSQLNRGPASRNDAPTKHDLKESGDIEASADSILLIHNRNGIDCGDVDVIVAKNRSGPCGTVTVRWTGRHLAFSDRNTGDA